MCHATFMVPRQIPWTWNTDCGVWNSIGPAGVVVKRPVAHQVWWVQKKKNMKSKRSFSLMCTSLKWWLLPIISPSFFLYVGPLDYRTPFMFSVRDVKDAGERGWGRGWCRLVCTWLLTGMLTWWQGGGVREWKSKVISWWDRCRY